MDEPTQPPPLEDGALALAQVETLSPLLPLAAAPIGDRVGRALTSAARVALRLGLLLALLTFCRSSLADQYHVPTGSMWPTIEPGDRIFVAKAAYGLRLPFTRFFLYDGGGPSPGDVVVFADPRGGPTPLVKRVVAVAGQTVTIHRGVLAIDGRPQQIERLDDGRMVERLGALPHATGARDFDDFGPAVVPPDHFFVLGDNRPSSLDSRAMGAISRKLLRGRVVGILYNRVGEGFDGTRFLRSID